MANYSKYLDSSFKIQGSEKTCSIQPLWIQDSNLRLRKNFFNPTCLDSRFKIQGSEKTSSIQPLWIQDSRFKASKKKSSLPPVWIQDSKFKAEGLPVQEVFWDLESWILPPWIQEVFLGSRILNPTPLGSRRSFWDHESWILNPTPLGSRSLLGILNLESWIRCT